MHFFLGGLTWRLQNGPIDLNFAKDYIADSLSDESIGINVSIGDTVLYWPDLAGPLFIGIKDVQLTNKEGHKLIEVGEAAIGLSRSRLLIGRIAPTALIIKNPGLRVIRTADNTLDFGFAENSAVTDTSDDQEGVLDKLISFVAHPGDENSTGNRFYRLRALSIENASLMVEDHRLGVSWFAQGVNLSMRSGRRGLSAAFDFTLPSSSEGETPAIKAKADYDWNSKVVDFSANIENFNMQFLTSRMPELGFMEGTNLPLNGTIGGRYAKETGLETLAVTLSAPEGKLRIPEVRDAPLTYKDIALDMAYSQATQAAEIKALSFDLEGVPVKAHGSFTLGLAENGVPKKVDGTLEAEIA
ncbi:MAG: hypothetical protein LRY39_00825, partial [Alphaproteobacteria bacterium]|nr:hypothetical protein [Alphaproteobacteria bacterium]